MVKILNQGVIWCILSAILIQIVFSKRSVKEVLLDDSSCYFSCQNCVGVEFTNCASCKLGYELKVIGTINDISAVGLQGRSVSLLTGSCECPSTNNNINETNEECSSSQQSLVSELSEYGIFAIGLSTGVIAISRLIFELHITFLLEYIDLLQFFSNFILLNQQDILSSQGIQQFFAAFNPLYLINKNSNNHSSDFLNVSALSTPFSNVKNSFKYQTIEIKNALQSDYYKLSNYLNPGPISFCDNSKWYFLLLFISLIISATARILHKTYLKKKIYPKAADSESDVEKESLRLSQVNDSFQGQIEAFRNRQRLTLDYRHSTYFTVYWYILTLPLILFYITLNAQLIYLQIQFSNASTTVLSTDTDNNQTPGTINISIPYEISDIICILGFCCWFIISTGIILKLCGQPESHLVLAKTVIFDGILTQRSCVSRYIPAIKVLFKTIEAILFMQFYHNSSTQLISIGLVQIIQMTVFSILRPFQKQSANGFLIFSTLPKIIVIIFRLIMLSCSQQQQTTLFSLFSALSAIQFTIIFFYFIIGLAIFILSLYFYFSANKQREVFQNFRKEQQQHQDQVSSNDSQKRLVNLQLNEFQQNFTIINTLDVSPDKSFLIKRQISQYCINPQPSASDQLNLTGNNYLQGLEMNERNNIIQNNYDGNITTCLQNNFTFEGGATTATISNINSNNTSIINDRQYNKDNTVNDQYNKLENLLDDLDKISGTTNNEDKQSALNKNVFSYQMSNSKTQSATTAETIDRSQRFQPTKEITIVSALHSNNNFDTISTPQTISSASSVISNKIENGLVYSRKRFFQASREIINLKQSQVYSLLDQPNANQFQQLHDYFVEEQQQLS